MWRKKLQAQFWWMLVWTSLNSSRLLRRLRWKGHLLRKFWRNELISAKLRRLQISLQPSFFSYIIRNKPLLTSMKPVKNSKMIFPYHYINFNIKMTFVNRFLNFLSKKLVFLTNCPLLCPKNVVLLSYASLKAVDKF